MKRMIMFLMMIGFLIGCSNRAAGARINDKGQGGGFIKGEVLKF